MPHAFLIFVGRTWKVPRNLEPWEMVEKCYPGWKFNHVQRLLSKEALTCSVNQSRSAAGAFLCLYLRGA